MDDEAAEIELLEQNLNKTHQISQRMTSILTSFDTRLVKLEKSILPLYNSTQILTRRAANIESALQKIDEVASNQEGIAVEEALILRGPQTTNLAAYKEAVERLNASIAFKSSDRDSRDTARLVETGAKKLSQLYTKLVAEGSSGTPPSALSSDQPSFTGSAPFPSSLLADLQPLVQFLRTLPQPSTHPSHPAAPAILSTLKEAQHGYADMRGNWVKKCLEVQGRWVVERAETMDGVEAGREVAKWVDNLLSVAEDEWALLNDLCPLTTPSLVQSTYSTLLNPLIALFSSTLSSLTSLIKRSLHRYTFLALSTYSSLISSQGRWDELINRRTGRKSNEFKESSHALRAVCLRSFPETIADLKAVAMGAGQVKGGETSTGLADFTTSTVEYLERIPEVKDAVGSALLTLGDGNWKMGDGMVNTKPSKLGEGDEQIIIEHFTYDVATSLLSSLTTLSRTQKWPAFGSIYLLNNVSWIRTRLLVDPISDIPSLLSKPTIEAIQSNFRTAKAAYFDLNFSPLMQALADDGTKSGGGKSAAKEKFTRFFDLLEEVTERHRIAKVLEDEPEARMQMAEESVKLVIPALKKFTQKNREREFSKNPQKYIKMSEQEVESQIKSFYK